MGNNRIAKRTLLFVAFSFCATHPISFQIEKQYKKFQEAVLANQDVINFELDQKDFSVSSDTVTRARNKKPWTFIVYMAADNDLRAFAANNLRQMSNVGSNQYINIVAHMDIRYQNNQKITRRYYVEKGQLKTMNGNDPQTQAMDSGNPQTLISACKWAITQFPAENYALILWNHGTGIIDPRPLKIINPAELFSFNIDTNKFDLDRSIGFLDLLYFMNYEERGICWDNSTGNYLDNTKFEAALLEIKEKYLNNQKFSIIGFDACLMSMLEVASIVKNYAHIMVSSQEVELGTGWNYHQALSALADGDTDKYSFARNIVSAFQRTYSKITNDYTQSALDLRYLPNLENTISEIGALLTKCLIKQKQNSVKQIITEARHKKVCTHFDEPSYIDLYCLLVNLEKNSMRFDLSDTPELKNQLTQKIAQAKAIIEQTVFANTAGKNLKNARGLSIYFPEKGIHHSYAKTNFAQKNNWYSFLNQFLKS